MTVNLFNNDILKKEKQNKRHLQIAKEIKVIISDVITKGKFRDEELFDLEVSISTVELSKDLSVAKVYISFWKDSIDIEKTLKALNRNNAFFRHKVGQQLHIKVIPRLHFYHDNQVDKLDKIQKILDTIKN